MSGLDDVKNAANPFAQLAKDTKKIVEQNETMIILLGALCDSVDGGTEVKREMIGIISTNHKELAAWKRKDTIMAWGVLSIACLALYLDYFRGWPVIKWFTSFIG